MKPELGITMGDFNGIGPEVTLKALRKSEIWDICHPVLIGSIDVFAWYSERLGLKAMFQEIEQIQRRSSRGSIPVLNLRKFQKPKIVCGTISTEGGSYAGEALEKAVKLCHVHELDGMVTAPVSKAAMLSAGYDYPGQTEMLADLSHSRHVAMMLVAGKMRVGLATVHVALNRVAKDISEQSVIERLSVVHRALRKDFAIPSPRIAVLGLNPHAGENGKMGKEEQEIVTPAIRFLQRKRMLVEGPFPADGFFGVKAHKRYDAVFAMYHDQGLIPLKIMGFDVGVNVTAGLPFVRTSPDHGTAFDIAGKGLANPRSMIEAIKLAVDIFNNRRRFSA